MAVYVDDMHKHPKGRLGRMRMSHMIADSHGELVAMADQIGVSRSWIQNPGSYREHFDISLSARSRAVEAGAIEVSMLGLGRLICSRKSGDPSNA